MPILCVLHEYWAGCLPFERRTDELHAAQAVALQALGTGRTTLESKCSTTIPFLSSPRKPLHTLIKQQFDMFLQF